MRENIKKINKLLYFKNLAYNDEKINTSLKRVFNTSFKKGGRFYGDHQSFTGKERGEFLLNGSKVIEVDYKGVSIKTLYIREGIDYKEDPYTISGYENLRKLFKVALQIIINAKDKRAALGAIKIELKKTKASPSEVLRLFEEKHPKLVKYFYSGFGLELQKEDSVMAEKILLEGAKNNIPIVPVHDSFIVE